MKMFSGFSESEEADNVAEILSKFRKEYSFKSLLGKENMQPDTVSVNSDELLLFFLWCENYLT